MSKTHSKRQQFPRRRDDDSEDMKGFLRSRQKGPTPGYQDYEMSSQDWQDDYEASESCAQHLDGE